MSTSLEFEEKKAFEAAELDEQHQRLSTAVPQNDGKADDEASQAPTQDTQLPPPPDGGLHAWLKVLGGFLVYINIWYV